MKFDPNDPKLTAYVLGELDEKERAEVEALIENNPDARAAVEGIREVTGLLEGGLASEPCPALDEERRAAIRREIEGGSVPRDGRVRWMHRRPLLRAALAASLLGVVSLAVWASVQSLRTSDGNGRLRPSAEAPDLARAQAEAEAPSPATSGSASGEGPVLSLDYALLDHRAVTADEQLRLSEGKKMTLVYQGWRTVGGETNGSQLLRAEIAPRDAEYLKKLGYVETERLEELGYLSDHDVEVAQGAVTVPDEAGRFHTEAYDAIVENPFLEAARNPLSTFSIDVDTASYSNVRRLLREGRFPPPGSVRLEELVNYFSYDYPQPEGDAAFSVTLEAAACPWNLDHRLVRIGLKGREIPREERPPLNLVFLLDVSGSMKPANKLPLVKESLRMLVPHLDSLDRVAIVVYAGASGLVLPSTTANEQGTILAALDRLEAGGSTNGGEGIELAYEVAREHLVTDGMNRVILCTDGDFNVGVTNRSELVRLVENRAKTGTYLTVLGFGMGNYKDSTLEQLADKGNGNYGYIDTPAEARKIFVEQLTGTLVTIAKDVKIQVEFNPREASAYRLLGYENRMLAAEDFNDDTKDAGEIGAGHTVTALYEVIPAGGKAPVAKVDPLRYQAPGEPSSTAFTGELLTVKLRYKDPTSADRTPAEPFTDVNGNGMFDNGEPFVDTDGNGRHDGEVIASRYLEFPLADTGRGYSEASRDFKFASAVASFGMILRNSQYKGEANLDGVLELAGEGIGDDPYGYRAEFLELVRRAASLLRR
jgi:Ca-activated chloride channel family protein